MSDFDWQSFLDQEHIPYQNTNRSNVATGCPWCGDSDYDQNNMSINLEGKGWRCWREPSRHAGIRPTKLVMGLLGCSFAYAASFTKNYKNVPANLLEKVNALFNTTQDIETTTDLDTPAEFRSFKPARHVAKPFIHYLCERGFHISDIMELFDKWGIRYCLTGPWRYRIMFLVRYDARLVSWTGRTIQRTQTGSQLRYKALDPDPEKAVKDGSAPAHAPLPSYLLWYDDLMTTRASTIVLCEGPMDALKVRSLGQQHGIAATCFFTITFGNDQMLLLHNLLPRFKRRILILDTGVIAESMRAQAKLRVFGVETRQLPSHVKDPAEINTTKELLDCLRFA